MTLALTTVLALLLQAATPQAEADVQATLGTDSVRVGEQFVLTISVTGIAEGAEVVFPELPDTGSVTSLGPPLVSGDQPVDSQSARYELAAWQTGELELPPAELIIIRDGAEMAIPLPGVTVQVTSVLPQEADPDTLAWEPPADVVGANWSLRDKLIGAGLALALLLIGIVYIRRTVISQPVAPAPSKTPSERAMDAFELLAQSGLIEASEFKAFYSALSYVLRQFLADNDDEWGLDLTTGEVVGAVASDGVTDQAVAMLGVLLIESDTVKFARRRPSQERAAWALEAARDFVTDFERVEPEPEFTFEDEAEAEAIPAAKLEAGLSIADADGEDQLAEIELVFADDGLEDDGEAVDVENDAEDAEGDEEKGQNP